MTKSNYWFEVFQDSANEWRWRLKAANGRIICDSAESFIDKGNAIDSIQLVISAVCSDATIQEKANDVIPPPKPAPKNPDPQGTYTKEIDGVVTTIRRRARGYNKRESEKKAR